MRKIIAVFCSILCALLILGIGFLWYLSPLYRPFPRPTGSYSVGIATLSFTDKSRQEIHAASPSPRELVADIYYPTEKILPLQAFPYQPQRIRAIVDVYSKHTWIPHYILKSLFTGIQSYANPNAQVTAGPFPVILFSHGIGGDTFYHVYLEELASHGYVIAAIYHTYDAEITVFPDGRIIELNPELRDMIDKSDRSRIYPYRAIAHKIWLQDLQFMIGEISKLNSDSSSMFYKKLALGKLGAFGHSHGGAVIIDLVKLDNRVKAGIDMDGWTKTANTSNAFNKPFMTMVGNNFDLSEPFTSGLTGWDIFLKNMRQNKDVSLIVIPGANHGSFSGSIQEKWPFGMRQYKADSIRKEIQDHILTFFNKYLGN